MKLKLIATAMIAAGLALSGCASHKQSTASAGESRSAAEFGSDAALTTKVKAALAKDAGLGTATQGIYHLTGSATNIGWQEGGLGKLAIELGVPGLLAVVVFAIAMIRLMLRITKHPDIPESSQFSRVTLFGLVVANIANFTASAQAYTDPMLVLISAFFVGCLFATATLDERAAAVAKPAAARVLAPATA